MQRVVFWIGVVVCIAGISLMAHADTQRAQKMATSGRKAAEYTLKKLNKEHKGKAIFDDLEAMMLSMMLACEMPAEPNTLEEDEEEPDENDENATRRNRRNRRDRDKQRRNRRNNTDPRRLRVRQRYRRTEEEPTA